MSVNWSPPPPLLHNPLGALHVLCKLHAYTDLLYLLYKLHNDRVLLLNNESWNACVTQWSITVLCIPKRSTWLLLTLLKNLPVGAGPIIQADGKRFILRQT
jgi:hypothetical protein